MLEGKPRASLCDARLSTRRERDFLQNSVMLNNSSSNTRNIEGNIFRYSDNMLSQVEHTEKSHRDSNSSHLELNSDKNFEFYKKTLKEDKT